MVGAAAGSVNPQITTVPLPAEITIGPPRCVPSLALACEGDSCLRPRCVGGGWCWGATPGLERARDAIREASHPLIRRIDYDPPALVDRESLSILLERGATEGDALALCCSLIVPLGGASENTLVFFAYSPEDNGWRPTTDCPS